MANVQDIMNEIDRIENAKGELAEAIGEKGVEVPAEAPIQQFPSYVRAIPTSIEEFYRCEYGVTTATEIAYALSNNLFPIVFYQNRLYIYHSEQNGKIYFITILSKESYFVSVDESNDAWSNDSAELYVKPTNGIPDTDLSQAVQGAIALALTAYQKPTTGIPASDLAEGVIPDTSDFAKKDGIYPDMVAGAAKALTGPTISDGFTYRKVGNGKSDNGLAIIDKIRGKSLVWNQLVKVSDYATKTLSDGSGTFTNNGNGSYTVTTTGTTTNSLMNAGIPYVTIGHKILIMATGDVNSYITFRVNGSVNIAVNTIYTATHTSAFPRIASGLPAGTYNIWFNLIDLTLMFGSGYEPTTVAEFEALYDLDYYANNPGQIISNKTEAIEVVGFNQWDEEWEEGTFQTTTGENIARAGQIRSKNLIRILPNTQYYIKQKDTTTLELLWLMFYDANLNIITGLDKTDVGARAKDGNSYNYSSGMGMITPPNAAFCKFYCTNSYPATYNHDICINISSSRNGQYEPYHKTTVPLNIPTITGKLNGEGESVVVFPQGMRSAGSVYDEIVGNKAIVRLAEVDLGDLNWVYDKGSQGAFSSTSLQSTIGANSAICSKYVCNLVFARPASMSDKQLAVNKAPGNTSGYFNLGEVIVKDSAYTDAATFKAAMAGVKLIYELATPLEYVLDAPVTPKTYQVDKDGTERRLPADTASVVSAPFKADIAYPATVQTSPDIFWATYGTTTAAEIDAAVAAGKIVAVKVVYSSGSNEHIHYLSQTLNSTRYEFFALDTIGGNYLYVVKCNKSNSAWNQGRVALQGTGELIDTLAHLIDNRTSETKYPSAKATFDGLGQYGIVSQTQTWTQAADGGYDYVMSNPVWGLIPQANIDLFVSAGATFNSTTGYFEIGDLTDISYQEMEVIYNATSTHRWSGIHNIYLPNCKDAFNVRTTLPIRYTGTSVSLGYQFTNSDIERAILMTTSTSALQTVTTLSSAFNQTKYLSRVSGVIKLTATSAQTISQAYSLREISIKNLLVSLSIKDSPRLELASIVYMVDNAANTSAITITLHATAYARCQADTTEYTYNGQTYTGILAYASARNITIASA